MATAKRLPSGAYNVRVYSHTEGNKKVYESFTASTKAEAELKASEWQAYKKRRARSDLTIHEAIEGYIKAKEGVLSPSTVRGYYKMLRNNFTLIERKQVRKITSEDLQIFVSSLSRDMSPKSVRNIYALLTASFALYAPDLSFKVTLPKKVNKRPVSPSDGDIQTLFREAQPELKKCIALAAFGSLRRGEICALTYGDIEGNTIHITKDMVQDKDNQWVLKDMPKTSDSIRDVSYPDEVIELLGTGDKDERIINYQNPGSITQCFTKLRNRLGLDIHFHSLRAYFCSIGAVLNIPTNYMEDFGGWRRGSTVMKEHYQNNIVSMSELYSARMKKHFAGLL